MRARLTYLGIFLIAAAGLALEILLTRIVSVISWYHLAFFVISLAMLGMTAGAIWVFLRREDFGADDVPRQLARYCAGFALLAPLAIAVLTIYPYLQVAWLSPERYHQPAITSDWHLGEQTFWIVDWQVERTETQNSLTIIWQSTANPPQNYSAFIHFLNEQEVQPNP